MQGLVVNLMKVAQLEAEMTGKKVSHELEQQLKLWGAGIFRLVVMGEIKKGKSSFINAMLGIKDLVPVSSNVATSTIFKIRYAKERGYRVYFLPSANRESIDISEYDLSKYGTEDGNPGNIERVDFIEVKCPAPLLRSGIVIIDTPGLGGLFMAHKQITYQYVPRADAVFFVTDSVESPIGVLEIEYLREILKMTPNLYFVQTKTSAVDEEAGAARRENNLSILSKVLGIDPGKIPYFMLDAELRFASQEDKDREILAMSGYPRVMAFINDELQPNQKKLLAARAMLRMQPIFTHLHSLISERESVVNADTVEKRRQCKEELEKKQTELRDWQENVLPKMSSTLQKGMRDLRLSATEKCSSLRPTGEIYQQMEEMIKQTASLDEITALVEHLNKKLPELAERVAQEVIQAIKTQATALLYDLANLDGGDGRMGTMTYTGENMHVSDMRALKLTESGTTFETLRTGVYGGMAGGMIASVVGGVIGSVVPVVGTFVGSTLGMVLAGWWGASEALKSKERNSLLMAQRELASQVSQTLSNIHMKLQQGVERVMQDIENEIRDTVTQYISSRKHELESCLKEVQERTQMTNDEQQKHKAQLQTRKSLLASIEREVRARFEIMEGKQRG